jgi:hypothetical protein
VNPTKVLCQIEVLLFVTVAAMLTILAPISGKALAGDPEITVLRHQTELHAA